MKKKHTVLKIILGVFALAIRYGGFRIWKMYSDHKKYMGHGFDYMHGYSTTDFTGYHVYDGQKLVTLDHRASLIIEKEEDMPVLDGAEACYPVYSALAKAVYKDIGSIEGKYHDEAEKAWSSKDGIKSVDYVVRNTYFYNGRIVTFSNTVEGYDRLVSGDVDIVLAARPSRNQKEKAMHQLEQIMTIPVGKEAFIFFVEEDNPVDNLTSEQIRGIYHGDITNWKQLGGKNQKIIAFQRPEDSGSQVMMKWFMGDVSLKEPKKVEYVGGMGDLLSKVAEYNNERGAMGYILGVCPQCNNVMSMPDDSNLVRCPTCQAEVSAASTSCYQMMASTLLNRPGTGVYLTVMSRPERKMKWNRLNLMNMFRKTAAGR